MEEVVPKMARRRGSQAGHLSLSGTIFGTTSSHSFFRHATEVWALERSRGDGHRSLVTHERILSEYNEDLIFVYVFKQGLYSKERDPEESAICRN